MKNNIAQDPSLNTQATIPSPYRTNPQGNL